MKLDKAIEILKDLLGDDPQLPPCDRRDAVKLGIEAMKHYRDSSHFACGCLLPGQTGETEGG